MLDLEDTKLEDYFEECFAFIDQIRAKNEKVLVHWYFQLEINLKSNAGVSRSASIVIGYLMQDNLQSYDEAYHFVKGKR